MIKSFLNLVWTPVLENFNKEEDIRNVQDFTVSILLKNPALLKDVWAQYHIQKEAEKDGRRAAGTKFMSLNMFKDLL